MRSAQKSNRSRGRGSRKGGGGNNVNRVYDSAGPEGKVRGTPQQIIDKYLGLARDAQTSGDRVAAENFLQHAEHYQRILIQAASVQEQRREQEQMDDFDGDGQQLRDDSASDQPEADAAPEQPDEQPNRRSQNGRRRRQQAEPEIGGMAMIEADEKAESLLVEEDQAPAKPKSRSTATKVSEDDAAQPEA